MQKRRKYISAQKREKRPRMNNEITAREVLLVDGENSEQLTIAEALARAEAAEVDLIEVSPKANPPVVKLADSGRFLYQMKKKQQQQKAHNKQTEVKTLRLGFRTDQHDVDRLLKRAEEFFTERHLVKFVIRLRGRELGNTEYAKEKLMGIVKDLSEVSDVEQEMRRQGNQFHVILKAKKG